MPAQITRDDGVATVGSAWHGLSVEVENAMTSEEAIRNANLDWHVGTREIYVHENGSQKLLEKWNSVYRADTGEDFAVMGKGYTPVQNTDMFKMFDSIVGSGEAVYHTVGSLFGGRKVWILAKFNGEVKLDDGDILNKYVLLSNTHDGSGALTAGFTPIRVVCWNTLSAALKGDGKKMYLRHTEGITSRAIDVREYLGLNNLYYERMMDECNSLIQKPLTKEQMVELALRVYRNDLSEDLKFSDINGASRASIQQTVSMFSSGTGTNGENAYDAFNAFTEFIDHSTPIQGSLDSIVSEDEKVREKRLEQTWFGKGARTRQQVFNILSDDNYVEVLKPINESLVADIAV